MFKVNETHLAEQPHYVNIMARRSWKYVRRDVFGVKESLNVFSITRDGVRRVVTRGS